MLALDNAGATTFLIGVSISKFTPVSRSITLGVLHKEKLET